MADRIALRRIGLMFGSVTAGVMLIAGMLVFAGPGFADSATAFGNTKPAVSQNR